MVLIVKKNAIYTTDGELLKEIYCPRGVSSAELDHDAKHHYHCNYCSEKVSNTDYMSEEELVSLLRKAPKTCLFINLENPIFEVVD